MGVASSRLKRTGQQGRKQAHAAAPDEVAHGAGESPVPTGRHARARPLTAAKFAAAKVAAGGAPGGGPPVGSGGQEEGGWALGRPAWRAPSSDACSPAL